MRGTACGARKDVEELLGASRLNGRGTTCATEGADTVAHGAGGVCRNITVLLTIARFDTLDVLGRLDLILPDKGTGVHCLTSVDVSGVLLLQQFGDLTCVHSTRGN